MTIAQRSSSLRAKILSLCSVLLVVLCLEGAARVAVFIKYGRQNLGFHHIFKYETFLVARTNERFLRAYGPKADRFRILVLGGSTADQFSSVSTEAYGKVFAKLTSKPIEVINFAQGGAISSQEVIMFARYGVQLHPDLVIVLDGVNDIVSLTKGMQPGIPYTDAYVQLAMNRPFLNALTAIGRRSQFVNVLRKLRERRVERSLQADGTANDLMVAEYLKNHYAMEALARGVGARWLSVLQPYVHLRATTTASEKARPAISNYAYRMEFMANALRRLGSELARQKRGPDADFVDSTSAFDGSSDDCFIDEVHLTERGKELLLVHMANQLNR